MNANPGILLHLKIWAPANLLNRNATLVTIDVNANTHHPFMNQYTQHMSIEPDPEDFAVDNEYELLLKDLASDGEDFARSEEEGWYYSDDD